MHRIHNHCHGGAGRRGRGQPQGAVFATDGEVVLEVDPSKHLGNEGVTRATSVSAFPSVPGVSSGDGAWGTGNGQDVHSTRTVLLELREAGGGQNGNTVAIVSERDLSHLCSSQTCSGLHQLDAPPGGGSIEGRGKVGKGKAVLK